MKRFFACLFPILTCLSVLLMFLLPQQITYLRDRELFGGVHTEELIAENALPIQPPELAQRMELLSVWMTASDVMSTQYDIMDEVQYAELQKTVWRELQTLADSGVVHEYLLPEKGAEFLISRLYVQRQLVGADFYVVDSYVKKENIHLWMVLDGETGMTLWLELGHPAMEKDYAASEQHDGASMASRIGEVFLKRLEVTCDLLSFGQYDAVFQISNAQVKYGVSIDPYFLKITPMLTFDYDSSQSSTAK